MTITDIKSFLLSKPGYLNEGPKRLSIHLKNKGYDVTISDCKVALKESRLERKSSDTSIIRGRHKASRQDIFNEAFVTRSSEIRSFGESIFNERRTINNRKNVLVIGDLHLPFSLRGYLEHCVKMYKLYNCDEVVFIGDIIDNHASSYHETNPDGLNAGEELAQAISEVAKWYQAFPKATVIIGNHDRIIMRKAFSSGLSKHWIKEFNEVLNTPGWKFQESIEIDDVLYIHGEGGTARTKMKNDLQSVVQGHLHTQCYVEWLVGAKFKIFGMQVGCGINHSSYALAYAKAGKKPAIACGVVLQGKTPINLLMDL